MLTSRKLTTHKFSSSGTCWRVGKSAFPFSSPRKHSNSKTSQMKARESRRVLPKWVCIFSLRNRSKISDIFPLSNNFSFTFPFLSHTHTRHYCLIIDNRKVFKSGRVYPLITQPSDDIKVNSHTIIFRISFELNLKFKFFQLDFHFTCRVYCQRFTPPHHPQHLRWSARVSILWIQQFSSSTNFAVHCWWYEKMLSSSKSRQRKESNKISFLSFQSASAPSFLIFSPRLRIFTFFFLLRNFHFSHSSTANEWKLMLRRHMKEEEMNDTKKFHRLRIHWSCRAFLNNLNNRFPWEISREQQSFFFLRIRTLKITEKDNQMEWEKLWKFHKTRWEHVKLSEISCLPQQWILLCFRSDASQSSRMSLIHTIQSFHWKSFKFSIQMNKFFERGILFELLNRMWK